MIKLIYDKNHGITLDNPIPTNLLVWNKLILLDRRTNKVLCYGTYLIMSKFEQPIRLNFSNNTYKKHIFEALITQIEINVKLKEIEYLKFLYVLKKYKGFKVTDLNKTLTLSYNYSSTYNFYVTDWTTKKVESFIDISKPKNATGIIALAITKHPNKHIISTYLGDIYLGIDKKYIGHILIEEIDSKGEVVQYYYY